MKRFTSMTLAFIMLLLCAVPLISGCKGTSEKDAYSVTQWLDMVENSFNMEYYTESEPIIQSVFKNDPNYDTVQIAAEWGLISPEDNLDFASYVTREFCADTLVTAMNFTDPASVEIADSDKVNPLYIDNVKIAVNEGVFALDGGKFNPQKELTKAEADAALAAAYDKWINFSFNGECFDKSIVKDNVVNLGSLDEGVAPIQSFDYKVDYSGSMDFFDAEGNYIDDTIKTITFSKDSMPDISEGSVLTMPADDVVPVDYAVVVDSITENPDGTVTVNTHNAELEDVFEKLEKRFSGDVDFVNASYFTPDGQRIILSDEEGVDLSPNNTSDRLTMKLSDNPAHEQTDPMALQNMQRVYSFDDNGGYKFDGFQPKNMANLKKGKGGTFDLGNGVKVTINPKLTDDGVKLDVKMSYKHSKDGSTVEVIATASLKAGLEFDLDAGFIYVHRALCKLNMKEAFGVKFLVDVDYSASLYDHLEEAYKEFVSEMSRMSSASSAAANICSRKILTVALGGGFNFEVRLYIKADGELSIGIEFNQAVGFEYVNGELRKILEVKSPDIDISLSAKLEVTLGFALSWKAFGFTVADLEFEAGEGMKLNSRCYEYDNTTGTIVSECGLKGAVFTPGQTPTFDGSANITGVFKIDNPNIQVCTELELYPIAKINICTKKSFIGKFCSYSADVSDSIPIARKKWHFESDNGAVDSCTRGVTESFGIEQGDDLTLNLNNLNSLVLSVGEEYTNLKVATLPKGVTKNDVKIKSGDNKILKAENLMTINTGNSAMDKMLVSIVNLATGQAGSVYYKEIPKSDADQFKLTGLADGKTSLTISAGQYSKTIEVIVGNGGLVNIPTGRFSIKNSTINLNGGESSKMEIESLPEGYDMSRIGFVSSDPDIAAVDASGNITANNANGSTIITASTDDGLYNVSCLVIVSQAADTTNTNGGGIAGGGTDGGGGMAFMFTL